MGSIISLWTCRRCIGNEEKCVDDIGKFEDGIRFLGTRRFQALFEMLSYYLTEKFDVVRESSCQSPNVH